MWTDLLVLIGIFTASIASSMYRTVCKMAAAPEPKLQPDLDAEIMARLPRDVAAFLQANGFQFAGAYGFHAVRFGIWTAPAGTPIERRLCFSLTAKGSNCEWVTEFSDDASLTTTRTRSAFIFPRIFGEFLQSFPNASIEQLWDSHVRGEQFLVLERAIPVRACRVPYTERLRRSMTRQLSYVRSLPLWPLRGVYWFLVKRFLMHNRPVWRQDLSGLYARLPGTVPARGVSV